MNFNFLLKISSVLFQGVETYKKWKDDRVIRDLEKKVKYLRILIGGLFIIIILMLIWILRH